MTYTYAKRAQIHYAETRPMQTVKLTEVQLRARFKAGGSITMDCSEGVTCLCKWAGLLDPNGLGYSGRGYTGTMLGNLPHYTDPRKAKVGALCVYGPGTGDHVAMVLSPGSNPLMWSHGSESGPILVHWSTERDWHRKPATFLSIAGL
jgi:hypothetical protein